MSKLPLKAEVLKCFKVLHRTRQKVFCGDKTALEAGREKINEEFRKYKHVTDETAIKELIAHANECEKLLRCAVIQAKQVEQNKFQVRITEDTIKLENVPFKDCTANGKTPRS